MKNDPKNMETTPSVPVLAETREVGQVAGNNTHTPGPWAWFDYPDGRKLLYARDCAVLHCPDAPLDVEPADARLIAAAPDLLAALKHAERFCPCGARPESLKTHPHVCGCPVGSAIAKAEGR